MRPAKVAYPRATPELGDDTLIEAAPSFLCAIEARTRGGDAMAETLIAPIRAPGPAPVVRPHPRANTPSESGRNQSTKLAGARSIVSRCKRPLVVALAALALASGGALARAGAGRGVFTGDMRQPAIEPARTPVPSSRRDVSDLGQIEPTQAAAEAHSASDDDPTPLPALSNGKTLERQAADAVAVGDFAAAAALYEALASTPAASSAFREAARLARRRAAAINRAGERSAP